MKSAINSLILLCGIFLLVTIGCKEEEPMIDPDIAARTCENGSLCEPGTVCTDNICGCPEGYYYIGTTWFPNADSICKKFSIYYHYKLTYSEGPGESFQYWPIINKPRGQNTKDTVRFNFYPITTPQQGGKAQNNEKSEPFFIRAVRTNSDVGSIKYFKNKSKLPNPLFTGIKGVSEDSLAGIWYLNYTLDSIMVKLHLFKYREAGSYINTVKLKYKRIGVL